LAAYRRCGYRFYAERVLRIPAVPSEASAGADTAPAASVLDPAERGTVVHALLERLDFRRPGLPTPEAIAAAAPRRPTRPELDDIARLFESFAASGLRARLGRATRVRREQRFVFLHDGLLITGMLDVLAAEPGDRTLIVDYKTDRLDEAEPAELVAREYATQQLVYALAGLRTGARSVEVVHVFLEDPEAPVSAIFEAERRPELEAALSELLAGLAVGTFNVTETPHRGVCRGCPAEGGLCSWPLEMTRRTAPDQLF
jgi:hypothetical protein